MRVYSLGELFTLTRTELFALHAKIVGELPLLAGINRDAALETLCKIRRVLAQIKAGP